MAGPLGVLDWKASIDENPTLRRCSRWVRHVAVESLCTISSTCRPAGFFQEMAQGRRRGGQARCSQLVVSHVPLDSFESRRVVLTRSPESQRTIIGIAEAQLEMLPLNPGVAAWPNEGETTPEPRLLGVQVERFLLGYQRTTRHKRNFVSPCAGRMSGY